MEWNTIFSHSFSRRIYLFRHRFFYIFFCVFNLNKLSFLSFIFHSIAIINISNNGTQAFMAMQRIWDSSERTTENSAFLEWLWLYFFTTGWCWCCASTHKMRFFFLLEQRKENRILKLIFLCAEFVQSVVRDVCKLTSSSIEGEGEGEGECVKIKA